MRRFWVLVLISIFSLSTLALYAQSVDAACADNAGECTSCSDCMSNGYVWRYCGSSEDGGWCQPTQDWCGWGDIGRLCLGTTACTCDTCNKKFCGKYCGTGMIDTCFGYDTAVCKSGEPTPECVLSENKCYYGYVRAAEGDEYCKFIGESSCYCARRDICYCSSEYGEVCTSGGCRIGSTTTTTTLPTCDKKCADAGYTGYGCTIDSTPCDVFPFCSGGTCRYDCINLGKGGTVCGSDDYCYCWNTVSCTNCDCEKCPSSTTSTTTTTTPTTSTTTTTTPTTCTGQIILNLNPSAVVPSGSVAPSASGLSGCSGKLITFRSGSCTGSSVRSCTSGGSGCTATSSFIAPSTAGTYPYFATIDKNGDGDTSDTGECGPANLTVSTTPTTSSTTTTTTTIGPQTFNVVVNVVQGGMVDVYKNGVLIGQSIQATTSTDFKTFQFTTGDTLKLNAYTSVWGWSFQKYCFDSGCTSPSTTNPLSKVVSSSTTVYVYFTSGSTTTTTTTSSTTTTTICPSCSTTTIPSGDTMLVTLNPGYNFIGVGGQITQAQLEAAGCEFDYWQKGTLLWDRYYQSEKLFTITQGVSTLRRLTTTTMQPWIGYLIFEKSADECTFIVAKGSLSMLVLKPGYNMVSVPVQLTQADIEAAGCTLDYWQKGDKLWSHYSVSEKLFTVVDGVSTLTRLTTTVMEPYRAYMIFNKGTTNCQVPLQSGQQPI